MSRSQFQGSRPRSFAATTLFSLTATSHLSVLLGYRHKGTNHPDPHSDTLVHTQGSGVVSVWIPRPEPRFTTRDKETVLGLFRIQGATQKL